MNKHGIYFCTLMLTAAPAFAASTEGSAAATPGQEATAQLPSFSDVDANSDGSIDQEEYARLSVEAPSAATGAGTTGTGEQTWEEKAEDTVLNQAAGQSD